MANLFSVYQTPVAPNEFVSPAPSPGGSPFIGRTTIIADRPSGLFTGAQQVYNQFGSEAAAEAEKLARAARETMQLQLAEDERNRRAWDENYRLNYQLWRDAQVMRERDENQRLLAEERARANERWRKGFGLDEMKIKSDIATAESKRKADEAFIKRYGQVENEKVYGPDAYEAVKRGTFDPEIFKDLLPPERIAILERENEMNKRRLREQYEDDLAIADFMNTFDRRRRAGDTTIGSPGVPGSDAARYVEAGKSKRVVMGRDGLWVPISKPGFSMYRQAPNPRLVPPDWTQSANTSTGTGASVGTDAERMLAAAIALRKIRPDLTTDQIKRAIRIGIIPPPANSPQNNILPPELDMRVEPAGEPVGVSPMTFNYWRNQ